MIISLNKDFYCIYLLHWFGSKEYAGVCPISLSLGERREYAQDRPQSITANELS